MKELFICCVAMLAANSMIAQGSVGIGTSTPTASAQLDINSSNKGLLIPRLTTAQRKAIAGPVPGLLVFDTDRQSLYMYNGNGWLQFATVERTTTVPASQTLSANEPADMGSDVDVDGDWAAVGAGALEVNDSTSNGAVYVMHRTNTGGWQIVQQLLPNSFDVGGHFGDAVSIRGDLIAVGAWNWDENQSGTGDGEGAVFIYKRNPATNVWSFLQKVISGSTQDGDWYGWSVDITSTNLIVGAPRDGINANDDDDGAFYIYEWNGTIFTSEIKLRHPNNAHNDDWFGNQVTVDGSYAAVAAWRRDIGTSANKGVVYIYVKGGGTWTFQDSVLATGITVEFGKGIDLDGSYLVVGSASSDVFNTWNAFVFNRSGSSWNQLDMVQSDVWADDDNNAYIDVSIDYPYVVVAAKEESLPAPYRGAVYVYEIVSGQLVQRKKFYDYQEYITNNGFGNTIAVHGSYVFIGSNRAYPITGGGFKGKVSIATVND